MRARITRMVRHPYLAVAQTLPVDDPADVSELSS
jgi:hypothetical protein